MWIFCCTQSAPTAPEQEGWIPIALIRGLSMLVQKSLRSGVTDALWGLAHLVLFHLRLPIVPASVPEIVYVVVFLFTVLLLYLTELTASTAHPGASIVLCLVFLLMLFPAAQVQPPFQWSAPPGGRVWCCSPSVR